MGKRLVPELFDDLDGSTPATSVSFGFNKLIFDIDLSALNQERLERALAPFVAVARVRQNESAQTEDLAPSPQIAEQNTIEIAAATAKTHAEPVLLREVESAESRAHTAADEVLRSYAEAALVFEGVDRKDFIRWARTSGYPVPKTNRISPPVLRAYLSTRGLSNRGETVNEVRDRLSPTQLRTWAASKGITLGARGRFSNSLWIQFANELDEPKDADPQDTAREQALQGAGEVLKVNRKRSTKKPSATSAPAQPLAAAATRKRNHKRIYPAGIREWARENGYVVGRAAVPAEILEAFALAHPEVK